MAIVSDEQVIKVLRQYNQLFPGGTYGLHHLQTV